MDVGRINRLISVAAILMFAFLSYASHADENDFALVRCNSAAGVLNVREDSTEDDVEAYKAPAGYQSKWLGTLVEYVSPPKGVSDDAVHGTYRRKIGDWRLSCTLNGVVYSIVVSPWNEENMVQAHCGPGDPDLELTVFRGRRMLIRDLRFGGGCLHSNATFLAVRLSESQQDVTLENILVPPSYKAGTDIRIPYSKMPMFDQTKSTILGPKKGERELSLSTR